MDANDRINVLLVDDQPAKLLSYEVMLQELGENLIKVPSAKIALETLLKTDVAVVLIDVCMPDLDGFELATMIRDHPRFRETAIIFVSAVHLTESDHLRGYRAGAVDYVPVPVVAEVLRAKVKVFAELYRKTRQLEQLNRELERRVTDRTAALAASTDRLIESERARSLALAAGNMGSWEYHFAEQCWNWDEGHSRIFGIDPAAPYSGAFAMRDYFPAEDWEALQVAVREADPHNTTFQREFRLRRASGEMRFCLVSVAASFDDKGELTRLDGVTIDITDRKEAELRQGLLAREVDHRARNTLAVVQSIVRLTKAKTMRDYTKAIDGRIRALAHAQELMSQARWQGADIVRLVSEEIAPYRIGDTAKIRIAGPPLILAPDKAQAIALSIHELATNAAKYGALSREAGQISVEWCVEDGALKLAWRETGGEGIKPPKSEGFGTKIINASIRAQSRGSVVFDWQPEGLRCVMSIPCSTDGTQDRANGEQAQARRSGARKDKILLLEDEALLAMLMRDILSEMGYGIAGPFTTVTEGFAAAQVEPLAAAVLDVNLGGQFVYPLAQYLKANGIPFIFVTGYARDIVEPEFDGVPVLQKPLTPEILQRALISVLSRTAEALPLSA